jgi:hypothetical protein
LGRPAALGEVELRDQYRMQDKKSVLLCEK